MNVPRSVKHNEVNEKLLNISAHIFLFGGSYIACENLAKLHVTGLAFVPFYFFLKRVHVSSAQQKFQILKSLSETLDLFYVFILLMSHFHLLPCFRPSYQCLAESLDELSLGVTAAACTNM